jgi:hypothetical protein
MSKLVKSIFISLSVVLLFFSTGCKSSKTTVAPTPIVIEQDQKTTPLWTTFNNTISKYKNWNDVVVPIDLSLISPKQVSVSGRVTMVKNQFIYISIRVLGFEVANVYITNDSIYASYKIDKIYIAEDLRSVLGGYPATIGDLQNLLLGRAFILGQGTITASMEKDFKLEEGTDFWKIIPDKIKNIGYEFLFEYWTNDLSTLTVDVDNKKRAYCTYGGPVSTSAGRIAKSVTVSSELKGKSVCAKIAWDFDDAKWNSGATHKWKTPKGYRRISVANFLKL